MEGAGHWACNTLCLCFHLDTEVALCIHKDCKSRQAARETYLAVVMSSATGLVRRWLCSSLGGSGFDVMLLMGSLNAG